MTFSEVLCHYLGGGLSTPEYKRGRQVCTCIDSLLSTTAVASIALVLYIRIYFLYTAIFYMASQAHESSNTHHGIVRMHTRRVQPKR